MSGHRRADLVPEPAIRAALASVLGDRLGKPCEVAHLARRPSASSTSFALEELDVTLADGTSLALVFKDGSRRALLPTAERIRPSFHFNLQREAEVYQHILAPAGMSTATLYGALVDPVEGRSWLFLERVPGFTLDQTGDFSAWKRAACWLAVFHGRFAGATDVPTPVKKLLIHYDDGFYCRWMQRVQAFARAPGWTWYGISDRELQWLADRYERVVERSRSLPITVIHGEFYASNVIIDATSTAPRVCPVDWETAAIGPGLMDLAALTAGAWSEAERHDLALAYWSGLDAGSRQQLPIDHFLAALDWCRLHQAVRWLGWSRTWRPPLAHAHDWWREAMLLARRIEL